MELVLPESDEWRLLGVQLLLQGVQGPVRRTLAPRVRDTETRDAHAQFCLHTCSPYMAEPSACRLMTCLPGHARAAPRAIGGPMPIAPPVSVKWEKGGAPCV